MKNENKGILIFHSLGSGKTLTSIIAVNCLLKLFPKTKVIVLTPVSLVDNYIKELDKIEADKEQFIIQTYVKGINLIERGLLSCKDAILVIDEAHNFRNNGKRAKSIIKCTKEAKKVILLSATPVQNNIEEIIPIMKMITGKKTSSIIHGLEGNSFQFNHLFKCNVSMYKVPESSDYPKVYRHIVKLYMSDSYYNKYRAVEQNARIVDLPDIYNNTKDLTTFINGVRRAVNTLGEHSEKVLWIINKLRSELKANRNMLIYSNWKDTGINIIKGMLLKYDIPFGEITGSVERTERGKIVKDFNSGKVKILLITSAGGEGISLRGTRNVIIMEPHWNMEKINQIIGRAIRYKSHIHLPHRERNVNVYELLLLKPDTWKRKLFDKNIPSADEVLFEMSLVKDSIIQSFYQKLSKVSIENDPDCMKNIDVSKVKRSQQSPSEKATTAKR